jgi:hypothetical protein
MKYKCTTCVEMYVLKTIAAFDVCRPVLCLKGLNVLKPCQMSYLRRRKINHNVVKFTGSCRIYLCLPVAEECPILSDGGRYCYDLRLRQKLLCSPRWQIFQC